MKTKYNIGDSVLVKGTVRRIVVDREGVIHYDLDVDGDIYTYGSVRVSENELDEIQKERNEK